MFKDFNIKEWLTLPPKIMVAICFATGLILFLPNNIIETIYLSEFKDKYGFALGVIFIVTLSILLFSFVAFCLKVLISRISSSLEIKKLNKKLENLNREEKLVLKTLSEQLDNTLKLPYNNGLIRKLEYYEIIGRIGNSAIVVNQNFDDVTFPYMLQPWVCDYLNKNPEFLNKI